MNTAMSHFAYKKIAQLSPSYLSAVFFLVDILQISFKNVQNITRLTYL
jgi:hypothetical protein